MQRMEKRLSEEEFQAALSRLDVGAQTVEIARGVLVEGRPQAEFVKAFGLTRGAVSQAVNRVWSAHQEQLPQGVERVSVVLPAHQAFIVKKWAKEFADKKGQGS